MRKPFRIPALLLLLLGCTPSPAGDQSPGGGIAAVAFKPLRAGEGAFLPDIDTAVARYAVLGNGPDGESFRADTASAGISIDSLSPGPWNIEIEAKNAAGDILGRGEVAIIVEGGHTSLASINLTPCYGLGTLDLTVLWDAGTAAHPSVSGRLIPLYGTAIDLPFTIISDTSAASRVDDIPAGFYLLIVKLFDDGVYVRGVLAAAWIADGRVTSGTIDLGGDSGGGTLIVNVLTETAAPLAVTMTGQAAQLPQGRRMTVSADSGDPEMNVVYLWYLNGLNVSTDRTVEVGAGLPIGVYRLDVTALTAGGERAGSATAMFQVTAEVP